MTHDKLKQITADNKTFEVDGTEFEIEPLTVKSFTRAQMKGEENEGVALREMFYHSLKNTEEMSREDIANAPAKFMVPLQEAVMEINDFEDFFDDDEIQEARQKLQ